MVPDSSQNLYSFRKNQGIQSRIKDLEGECRIKNLQFLKYNIPKTILLLFLLIVTVFGLIPLKYFPKFRKQIFYSKCSPELATHLYITGKKTKDDIVKLDQARNFPKTFMYRKLRYIMISPEDFYPVGFKIEQKFDKFINQ